MKASDAQRKQMGRYTPTRLHQDHGLVQDGCCYRHIYQQVSIYAVGLHVNRQF